MWFLSSLMTLATTWKPPFINKIHSQKNIQPLFANAIEKQKLHLLVSYFINCNTSYILNGLYSGSDLRRANYKAKFPLPLKLSSRCHRCTTCWKVFCILEIVINVKVSKFQNEFKSHHSSQNMNQILSGYLPCTVPHSRVESCTIFSLYFVETNTSYIPFEAYWPLGKYTK